MIKAGIILIIGFTSSLISMPIIIEIMRKKSIVGIDVHKKDKPLIPEMCGLAILIGITISSFSAIFLMPNKTNLFISFLFTALIAGVIGAVDDIKNLNSKVKPFLSMFSAFPILILHNYNFYGPILPIIGQTRLTLIYPFIILIAIAITSNSVNMMDPFNGTMSGSCTIINIVLLVSAFFLGRFDAFFLSVCLLGPLLVLFYFNRYPSKVFSGDVGSLSIGAALGAIAVLGQVEIIAVVAFIPQIMNAFYGLSTIGRLYERREVSRPVTLLDDGRLKASNNPKAPMTLARIILARGPLYEYEAARVFLILSLISGFFALITTYLLVIT